MKDEDEDINWFKTLPWWQKILVLLVGFGIAALFFLDRKSLGLGGGVEFAVPIKNKK